LDETINLAADEGFGLADEPLLTDIQARGLRILFGLHVDSRWMSVDDRRVEAGQILLDKRDIVADTYHRTYEEDARRIVLECLRARYGQESSGFAHSYESIRRNTFQVVGSNRRASSVRINNVFRSRVDGLDFVRVWFYLREPDLVQEVMIRDLIGVDDYTLEAREEGAYRLTLHLPQAVELGRNIEWGYTRDFTYVENAPPPTEGRVGISARNDGFVASATVQFEADQPSFIWIYSRRKNYYPIQVSESLLVPDLDGKVHYPETSETSMLRVYGIAWRW